MPTNDAMAYGELFYTLRQSLMARKPLNIRTIQAHPIMAYTRIRNVALNLGMSTIADDLGNRLDGILNPNLIVGTMAIPAADIEAVFKLYPKSHALRMKLTDAIGRGLSCRRINRMFFKEISQLLEENKGIKSEILAAKRTICSTACRDTF